MRFVLVTFGTGGDVYPYIALGRTLIRRGHAVTLYANEPFGDVARRHGIVFEPFATREEFDELLSDPEFWHPFKGPAKGARWGLPRLESEFRRLLALSRGADALVSSFATLAGRCVQERTSMPLATVVLQPGLIPSVVDPPVLPAGPALTASSPWVFRRLQRGFADLWGEHMVVKRLNRVRRRLDLPPVRGLYRWWYSPDLTIALFPGWYGPPPADWPPQLRLAGFPLGDVEVDRELSPKAREFLDAGDAPVAFTAGTGMRYATRFFREGVEACRRIGRRALLVTAHHEQVPDALPAGAALSAYEPFDALFPRCAAVVHHGGIGTTARALASGVPQLIAPVAWDQPDNARRIRRLAAGDALPQGRVRAREVAAKLENVLSPSTRERCRELAARCDGRALDTAAGWLEQLATRSAQSR